MWNAFRCGSSSRNHSRSRILCWALVALLVWQVSGRVPPPLEPISSVSAPGSPMRRRHWRHGWKNPQQQQHRLSRDAADDARDASRRLVAKTIRGGGMVSDLNDYIGATKTRSWTVLMMSIACDTVAVTLMKQAQEEAALHKMVLPFGLFFLR